MNIIKANEKDIEIISYIISTANKDVAIKFALTKKNNPKHPSFYTKEWVLSDFKRNEEYFLYKEKDSFVACVAFEQRDNKAYLNRLAVLPDYRQKGIGEKLVRHIFSYAKSKKLSYISIGIIKKHEKLKNWYSKLGFVENGFKEFEHLPFDVQFMKYKL